MTSDTRAAAIDHPIGSTGRLTVKVAGCDVRLAPSPDDHVRVRSADGRPLPEDFEIETGVGSLSIRQVGRFLGIKLEFGVGRSAGLEIEVPPTADTTIQTASGSLAATGLTGEQHYRTASGDVRLDLAAGQITAETVAGDVKLGVDGTVELVVRTVSGDVEVDGGRLERIRLTTTSGDIRLVSSFGAGPHAIETLSGDAQIATNSGVRIQARTISGDLRSDLPHTADGMMGRRSLTVGDGAVELSFRSVSGDLRVVDPAGSTDRTTDRTTDRPKASANGAGPTLPVPPAAPTPPTPPTAPSPATQAAAAAPASSADPNEDRRLEILRALERGEIDIEAAGNRLALLDEPTNG